MALDLFQNAPAHRRLYLHHRRNTIAELAEQIGLDVEINLSNRDVAILIMYDLFGLTQFARRTGSTVIVIAFDR